MELCNIIPIKKVLNEKKIISGILTFNILLLMGCGGSSSDIRVDNNTTMQENTLRYKNSVSRIFDIPIYKDDWGGDIYSSSYVLNKYLGSGKEYKYTSNGINVVEAFYKEETNKTSFIKKVSNY